MISTLFASIILGPVPTLNIKVEGDGYLRFARGTNLLYAKSAIISPSAKGLIASDGSVLAPRVEVPTGLTSLECDLQGNLSGTVSGSKRFLGRLVIAQFSSKPSFVQFGSMLSTLSKPTLANPGEGVAGVIRPVQKLASANKPASKAIAAQPFGSSLVSISVRPQSEVDDEYITLGAIADIEGDTETVEALKKVNFGRSPYFGTWRGLTTVAVKAQIASARFDVKKLEISVPTGAKVARKGQTIEPETFDKAVAEAFKNQFGVETELTQKVKQNAVPIPVGEYVLNIKNLNVREGEVSATAEAKIGNKLVASISLVYNAPGLAQVKKGDKIRLRMIAASAKIEVTAKVESNALLGQSVKVSTDTGAILNGTLVGPGLVEVKL